MPSVRVERLPVEILGLGRFGFDHLQIVFRSDFGLTPAAQDDWFVIEGIREAGEDGVRLAVEGWHGGTTLSEANGGRTDAALIARIGTPESRDPREIAEGSNAIELWATLVSYAADIHAQRFPYIPMTLPGSPLPIINSSSLVSSLLHHAGIDVEAAMPPGLRFSPGRKTLLATSADDTLVAGRGFTTVLAGVGDDRLKGRDAPGLDYANDGVDVIDDARAGDVALEAPHRATPHVAPDFVATYADGEDHLYSIDEIVWDQRSDLLPIGSGVGVASPPLRIDLKGDVLDLRNAERLRVLLGGGNDAVFARGIEIVVHDRNGTSRYVVGAGPASLAIHVATPCDRIVVTWMPARVTAHYDRMRPEDLVVRLWPHAGSRKRAEIRVRGHRPGDLALDVATGIGLREDADGLSLSSGSAPDLADKNETSAPPTSSVTRQSGPVQRGG